MKKLYPIKKFKEGMIIQGFYLCIEKSLRYTRTGDLYIDLEVRDKTGHISAKIWDKVDLLNGQFEAGDAVAISGEIHLFLDQPQLIIKKIKKATKKNYGRYGFDPANLVPTSKIDPLIMWEEIGKTISLINNNFLKRLVSNIYKKNKKKLLIYPASMKMNHSYRSGYLENIISMIRVGKKVSSLYKIDRDLLMTGIMLHNIGVIEEFNSGYEVDYTYKGNLIGNNVIGKDIVKGAIGNIKNFPENLACRIEHIILSHRGYFHRNTPKQPAFREALLVHLISNLDMKMNIIDMIYREDPNQENFTDIHNYFRTPMLKDDD